MQQELWWICPILVRTDFCAGPSACSRQQLLYETHQYTRISREWAFAVMYRPPTVLCAGTACMCPHAIVSRTKSTAVSILAPLLSESTVKHGCFINWSNMIWELRIHSAHNEQLGWVLEKLFFFHSQARAVICSPTSSFVHFIFTYTWHRVLSKVTE